jgi:uncharacterized membrane-anchored protein YitT (DUF2179 family)
MKVTRHSVGSEHFKSFAVCLLYKLHMFFNIPCSLYSSKLIAFKQTVLLIRDNNYFMVPFVKTHFYVHYFPHKPSLIS